MGVLKSKYEMSNAERLDPWPGPVIWVANSPNKLTKEDAQKYLSLPVLEHIKTDSPNKYSSDRERVIQRVIRRCWGRGMLTWDRGFMVNVREDGSIHSICTTYGCRYVEYDTDGNCTYRRDEDGVIYDRKEVVKNVSLAACAVLFLLLILLCSV